MSEACSLLDDKASSSELFNLHIEYARMRWESMKRN